MLQGNKGDWWYDDYIPNDVAYEMYMEAEHVDMVNEGGGIEVDGRGTLMAKRSSILNDNRNPGMTQQEAEDYYRYYLGVTNFIWLDGIAGREITDDHIDGTARFANGDTIVTYPRDQFWEPTEYDVLVNARDTNGNPYKIVELPRTLNKVSGVNEYGIYINYYVGNKVVILPVFNDPNDDNAAKILQQLYPTKTIVPIEFTELYIDGGLVHCVTMQEPSPMK